jgi:hypothetical protein
MTSSHDVEAAIRRYGKALELASACRSATQAVEQAGRLGCRVDGGAPPDPQIFELGAAMHPLRLCTDAERELLLIKYWHGAKWGNVERKWGNTRVEYPIRIYRTDGEVAEIIGAPSCRAVRARLERARAKIREGLRA